jgi:tripartite-type tricarboxylate transporter receptor subunit TctC
MEAMRAKLSAQGLQLTSGSPEELAVLIKSDIDKWSKVIKTAGIKPE